MFPFSKKVASHCFFLLRLAMSMPLSSPSASVPCFYNNVEGNQQEWKELSFGMNIPFSHLHVRRGQAEGRTMGPTNHPPPHHLHANLLPPLSLSIREKCKTNVGNGRTKPRKTRRGLLNSETSHLNWRGRRERGPSGFRNHTQLQQNSHGGSEEAHDGNPGSQFSLAPEASSSWPKDLRKYHTRN